MIKGFGKITFLMCLCLSTFAQTNGLGIDSLNEIDDYSLRVILSEQVNPEIVNRYQSLAKNNPQNREALLGLEKIKNTYLDLAQNALNLGDINQAIFFKRQLGSIDILSKQFVTVETLIDDNLYINQPLITINPNTVTSTNSITGDSGGGTSRQIMQVTAPPESSKFGLPRNQTIVGHAKVIQNGRNRVDRLLKLAEQDLEADRLSKNLNSNAQEKYLRVLQLDANNKEAIQGLDYIYNTYLSYIHQAVESGDFPAANKHLRQLKKIAPDAEQVKQGQFMLAAKRNIGDVVVNNLAEHKVLSKELYNRKSTAKISKNASKSQSSKSLKVEYNEFREGKATTESIDFSGSSLNENDDSFDVIKQPLLSNIFNIDLESNPLKESEVVTSSISKGSTRRSSLKFTPNKLPAPTPVLSEKRIPNKANSSINVSNKRSTPIAKPTNQETHKLEQSNTKNQVPSILANNETPNKIRPNEIIPDAEKLENASSSVSAISNVFIPRVVTIPSGSFIMGCQSKHGCYSNAKPTREVYVASFKMSVNEVTVGQFKKFTEETNYLTDAERGVKFKGCDGVGDWRNPGFKQSDNHPVVCVSWHDTQVYLTWLRKYSGLSYQLPNEAQWEYAARAGSKQDYFFGNNAIQLCQYANIADKSTKQLWALDCNDGISVGTARVGKYLANPYGLFDILGNANEWVSDCYHWNYNNAPVKAKSWQRGGDCGMGIIRGGAWSKSAKAAKVDNRNPREKWNRSHHIGFRVVINE